VITTRLASAAAASLFGLAALAGTALTVAAPATASTGAPSAGSSTAAPSDTASSAEPSHDASSGVPAIHIARPHAAESTAGKPFSKNPYQQVNPFPSLPGNPWGR
jgi:hypothetical protein